MTPTDILGNIKLYNADCMEVMKTFKDKQFDLAIVDPPYGLGKRTTDGGSKRNTQTKFMEDIRRTSWDDSTPAKEYFDELKRVSKNQIVWGGNYFELHSYRTFIVWDKMTYIPTMSQVEMAATSFDSPARLVKINSNQSDRIHPTQKPIQLYKWLLQNYAKEGDTILDTHFGSLSIGIACHDMKFDLTAIELDKDYYEQAKQRLINHQRQLQLF
jgi:site-specific DNA-methyltransferase (adenine-specific)